MSPYVRTCMFAYFDSIVNQRIAAAFYDTVDALNFFVRIGILSWEEWEELVI